jgi:hypothetical protein
MVPTILMAIAMSMAPAKADPVDNARKAFSNCIMELHNKSVGDKMSTSAFRDAANSACTTEKTTFHNLIVKAEIGYKSKPADAEQYAKEEVQTVIDNIISAFGDNVESGAKLTLEK